MNKTLQFGEQVEGYPIPVLNEREIRASAGLLFLATFISLGLIIFQNNFVPIKYVVTIFFIDFLIRLFVNPGFSPTLIIGRLIVRNQVPEYVGAAPKRFAWFIGLVLSAGMFLLMVVINSFSTISGLSCIICLVFLFFESAFGICIGCKIYSLFNSAKVQYCPGEVCVTKERQQIQQTSKAQLLVVLVFIAGIVLAGWLFKDEFRKKPFALFGNITLSQPAKVLGQDLPVAFANYLYSPANVLFCSTSSN